MANGIRLQPGSAPSGSTGARPTRDESLDFELDTPSPTKERVRFTSPGSNDGHPNDATLLKSPVQPPQSEASSVIRDHGYSLPFTDIAEDRPPEQNLDLAGLGTQFGAGTTDSFASAKSDDTTEMYNLLEKEIRSKRVKFADRHDLVFLPIDQLERIMTYEKIYQELSHAGIQESLHEISVSLCKRGKPSRQRVFAVLCMLQMSAQIVHFIEEKIFDRDLPFVFTDDAVYRETSAGSVELRVPIPLFQSSAWQPIHLESFQKYQGQVAAPIFKLSWRAGEKVLHFALKDQLVLPFMLAEGASGRNDLETIILRHGGTSIVRRVKIHKAHFNSSPDTKVKEDVYFAVKKLEAAGGSDGIHEDRTLKRINEQSDPHLIRLLATYTYEGRFHMIFPWANGNLQDLWTKFPHSMANTPQGMEIARWMSTQILGLAKALKSIHYCPVDKANIHNLSDDDRKKPHGRHGDLKPENILWFNADNYLEAEATNSILQIADFGFADFHSQHSKSNVRRSKVGGFTDTYKAPEYDIKHKVSPQYDIWSFACIVFQFVVWYLKGWKGVDDFSRARTAESRGAPIESDTFYVVESDGNGHLVARTKSSVIEMFEILTMDDLKDPCSDYVLELLEFIRAKLLKVKSADRATIDDIVEEFGRKNELCQQLDEYCTSRSKKAKRPDSGRSEINESVVVADSPANKALVPDSPPLPAGSFGSHQSHAQKIHSSVSRARENEQGRPRSKLGPASSSASCQSLGGLGLTTTLMNGAPMGSYNEKQPNHLLQPSDSGHMKGKEDSGHLLQFSSKAEQTILQSPTGSFRPSKTTSSLLVETSTSQAERLANFPALTGYGNSPNSPITRTAADQLQVDNENVSPVPEPLETGEEEKITVLPHKQERPDSADVIPQSGWKRIKKRVHKHARKALDWCLCEDGP